MSSSLKNLIRMIPLAVKANMAGNKKFAFSFNLSDRCPIGCHCYWKAQERVSELSDGEVISFFEAMKKKGFKHATIVGGEPYVRPTLLAHVTSIMDSNWIVTSGTTPLLRLEKTTHFVSIDGASATTHDTIRGSRGLYERIMKNLRAFRKNGRLPVFIHSVLNRMNYLQMLDILVVWRDNGLADGVLFSTATPIKDFGGNLYLAATEREWIVKKLLICKKTFGSFLCMTEDMINKLHPDATKYLSPSVCKTSQLIPSFNAEGLQMDQCILSDKADCTECGCVISGMLEDLTSLNIRRMIPLVRLITL